MQPRHAALPEAAVASDSAHPLLVYRIWVQRWVQLNQEVKPDLPVCDGVYPPFLLRTGESAPFVKETLCPARGYLVCLQLFLRMTARAACSVVCFENRR